MSATYDIVPFSDLLHRPAVTVGFLDRVRALRLRRRDAGDLALMRVEQLDSDDAVALDVAKDHLRYQTVRELPGVEGKAVRDAGNIAITEL